MSGLREKLHWHANVWLQRHLGLLSLCKGWLSVISVFQTPGDTLLAATVCRNIKRRWPGIRINCVAPHSSLIANDPDIDSFNGEIGLWSLRFDYLDVIHGRKAGVNILQPTMDRLRIGDFAYRAKTHLCEDELNEARERLKDHCKPIISLNVMSREAVKVWGVDRWRELCRALSDRYTLVQLGDDREPELPGVISFAGALSLRQTFAVLAYARFHLGCVSVLMHAANGLDVPSVIIYGGRETPQNSGYPENVNLASSPACSPCWIHNSEGQECLYQMQCMEAITVQDVLSGIETLDRRIEPLFPGRWLSFRSTEQSG